MTAGALLILLSSIALAFPSLALAAGAPPIRQYAWETECRHPLPEDARFTAQEKWAWNERLCLGKIAKMSEYDSADKKGCDAKKSDTWPQTRRLSERFLRTILFHEPFKSVPPRPQIDIECALFEEKIDFTDLELKNEVWLSKSRFKKKFNLFFLRAHHSITFGRSVFDDEIILEGAKIDGRLNVRGSTFKGPFKADSLEVSETLLLDQSATFKQEVRLLGAKIHGQLNARGSTFEGSFEADSLEVSGGVFLDQKTSFKKDVGLRGANIAVHLIAKDSKFEGLIHADRLEVKGSVFLDKSVFLNESPNIKAGIVLIDAKITKELSVNGSTFEGDFQADRLEVKGRVSLDGGATFRGKVVLRSAKIGSELTTKGSTFEGEFQAEHLDVKGDVYLSENATFKKEVRLLGAKIDGQLNARSSRFEGPFQAEKIEVSRGLFLDQGASFRDGVNLLGGTFKSGVSIAGSTFYRDVDFTGSTIKQDFVLASTQIDAGRPPTWLEGSSLILRNVAVGALQESRAAWCKQDREKDCLKNNKEGFIPVDLQGFTYDRLGGLDVARAPDAMDARETEWLVAWLSAQPDHGHRYIPQPYRQLANILRETGNPTKANEILYALREHQRTAASTPWPAKIWLTLQWALIGYGYANWRALIWFAVLVGAGVWACDRAENLEKMPSCSKFWYSLDRALPLVKLGATEDIKNPSNWVGSYFYIHQIIGFVLATFLAVGLSGFTK